MRRGLLGIVFALACGELLHREPGQPCDDDALCEGVCWEGRCHATRSHTCDPRAPQGQPCLREAAPDEGACRAEREGEVVCTEEGKTTCRPIHRFWREVPDNTCDDDHDAVVDEAHGECEGDRERTWLDGYEGVPRIILDTTVARYHDPRRVPVDFLDEDQSSSAAWTAGGIPWTYASDCPHAAEPLSYRGRSISWALPALPRPGRFSLEFHHFAFAPRRRPGGHLGPTVTVAIESASGNLYLPPPAPSHVTDQSIDPAHWSCLPLEAGASIIHFFDTTPGGCPCDAYDCPDGPLFAPISLIIDQASLR